METCHGYACMIVMVPLSLDRLSRWKGMETIGSLPISLAMSPCSLDRLSRLKGMETLSSVNTASLAFGYAFPFEGTRF